MASSEDAGAEVIANVLVNDVSSAVAETSTCNFSETGLIVKAKDGVGAY